MNIQRVADYLDSRGVKFTTMTHSRTFTAQRTAASADIPGREMAKTVMVRIDGTMAMAVLPAPYQVDFHLLKKRTGAKVAVLAAEDEFAHIFPDCEVGAMPPFGNLYGMDVFVDKHLTEDENIVFHSGSLTELMKLSYTDYASLVNPIVADISIPLGRTRHAA